jgi:hypothetical protein
MIPYTGSSVRVRFMVNAETLFRERMYRKKVKMVQIQLNMMSQTQSITAGAAAGILNKKLYRGMIKVRPKNPPVNW